MTSSAILKIDSFWFLYKFALNDAPRRSYDSDSTVLPKEQDWKAFPGISNVWPRSSPKTLEQKSFIFLSSSGASATQNPIVPNSPLINHQAFPFKAGIVVAWRADELQFHDQLTSHQHVNPSSQTEVSLHKRNKWSRSKIPTGFNQLALTRRKSTIWGWPWK